MNDTSTESVETKEKNKEEQITISEKRKEEILDQIFDKGYATKILVLVKDRLEIKVRNLSVKNQLNSERNVSSRQNASYALHDYLTNLISNVMLEYNGEKIKDIKDAREKVENLPASLLDKSAKEYRIFQKEIDLALEVESVKENFTQGVELPKE